MTLPMREETKPPPNLLGHYAGFISRLLAFMIDIVIISVTILLSTWFISATMEMLQIDVVIRWFTDTFPTIKPYLDRVYKPVAAGILASIFFIFYHVFFLFFTGQTPGKALFGVRVVPLRGGKMHLWRAILRYIGYFISGAALGLGFFWILIDDRRMAWHDKLARTCVVYTWNAQPDERFLVSAIRILTSRSEAIKELRLRRNQLAKMLQNQKKSDSAATEHPPEN